MPQTVSQSSSVPPPPPGYSLDSSAPPPPPGYQLDSPEQPTPILAGYQRAGRILKEGGKDLLSAVGSMADAVASGPLQGALKIGQGMVGGHVQAYQDAKDAAEQGNTAKSMFKSVAAGVPIVGPMASDIYDDAEAGNNDRAVGKGLSRILQVAAPEIAPHVLPAAGKVASGAVDTLNSARGALAEKAVAPLVRKPLGATLEDAKFGRDPVKAITDEGLAGTKEQVLEQAKSRVGQISDAVDQTLKNHPNSGVQIDAAPIIDSAIDNAVSSAKKTGNKAVVTRLENLREALKTEYGPTKGTPYEINQLKREVGQIGSDLGAFKSTDPLEASAAGAMADVYSGLKKAVNEQVPEIAPLNERISNLISAQTALKRNLALQENSSLLDSHTLFSAGAKAVKNTVASAPVRTFASKILNAGNALAEPEVVPQQTSAAATAKARFQAARAAAESKSNAVPVDDLQGGHAGNSVSPRAAAGLRWISKAGKVADKLSGADSGGLAEIIQPHAEKITALSQQLADALSKANALPPEGPTANLDDLAFNEAEKFGITKSKWSTLSEVSKDIWRRQVQPKQR